MDLACRFCHQPSTAIYGSVGSRVEGARVWRRSLTHEPRDDLARASKGVRIGRTDDRIRLRLIVA